MSPKKGKPPAPALPLPQAPEPSGERVLASAFDLRTKETTPFDLAKLDEVLARPETFVWVDIEGKVESFDGLLRRLKVDPSPAGDFERPEILPKIIETTDALAFRLYEVEDPNLHLDTSGGIREIEVQRMAVVIGRRFIVTYHPTRMGIVSYIARDCAFNFSQWGKTPSFIAFLFLQRCLYDYALLNLANDNYLDRMEEAVLSGDTQSLAEDVSLSGKNILTLKKLGGSLQIVLMTLSTKKSVFISEEAREFYQEMLQNSIAVRSTIDSSRDLLDGVVSSLHTQAAHRTGEVARLLTIVSSIILPLSLITSIYGMNFKHMPELEVEWGYHALLAIMALVGAVFVLVFKRLGWLDTDVVLRPAPSRKSRRAAEARTR